MSIEQDLIDLNKEYISNASKLIRKYIKSKAKLWKRIPLLYFIEEGKCGYSSNWQLLQDHMYRIDDSFIYINCDNARIYFYNATENGEYVFVLAKDITKLVKGLIHSGTSSINPEKICAYYIKQAEYPFNATDDNGVKDREWILKSIMYNIPITYDDFKAHFDPKYKMTEQDFHTCYDKIMIRYTKFKLKNPNIDGENAIKELVTWRK
jgi:hypothetical protein